MQPPCSSTILRQIDSPSPDTRAPLVGGVERLEYMCDVGKPRPVIADTEYDFPILSAHLYANMQPADLRVVPHRVAD